MKKTILYALAALALVVGGCGSDADDEGTQPAPAPTTLAMGTDEKPQWQAPNYDRYEQTMTVEVLLQDTLLPYAGDGDLLCATIGDEVRGVALPVDYDGQWLFTITVASNEAGRPVTLSYYCDRLKRIFTTPWTDFDASTPPTGEDGIYKPAFVK
jgi:hypothetical protein